MKTTLNRITGCSTSKGSHDITSLYWTLVRVDETTGIRIIANIVKSVFSSLWFLKLKINYHLRLTTCAKLVNCPFRLTSSNDVFKFCF